MAGPDIERERRDLAPGIEGLFVQDDALAEQRVGVGGQEIEIGEVAIVGVEIVYARLLGFQVHRRRWLIAPGVGADLNRIEPAMLGIGQREVRAQELGPGAQIDDAAIGVQAAPDAGVPTVAEVDPTA